MTEPTRVVVVDDHRMVAESIVRVLEAEPGIEVVAVAGSAAEAVDAVRRQRPHVVVLDFHLPDATGAAAIGPMRAHVPEVQVVMITGDVDNDAVLSAIDAGCVGFVTKDRAVDELVGAVRSAARGEPTISTRVLSRLIARGARRSRVELTERELKVLELLAAGCSNDTIAEQLFLSRSTVRNHVQNILGKLDAHSKLEAVVKGVGAGLVKISAPA